MKQNNNMTKTYTEVQENSVRNFRSRHLISSGRSRLSSLAKEKLRRSRYSSKPPTERYDTLSENVRQCHLWECIGTQGRSRLRKIWKLGYFGSGVEMKTDFLFSLSFVFIFWIFLFTLSFVLTFFEIFGFHYLSFLWITVKTDISFSG